MTTRVRFPSWLTELHLSISWVFTILQFSRTLMEKSKAISDATECDFWYGFTLFSEVHFMIFGINGLIRQATKDFKIITLIPLVIIYYFIVDV